MDAVIFIFLAMGLTIKAIYGKEEVTATTFDVVPEDTARSSKLNDTFYEDTSAFTTIVTALGFPPV